MKSLKTRTLIGIITIAGIAVLALSIAGEPQQSADNTSQTVLNAATTTPWTGEFSKPGADELEARLTPLQYEVTQNEATERPFNNEYWDNKGAGIYVDIVSGEPLFSSTDKFKSGTGWPSFTRPISAEALSTHTDTRFFMKRVELKSSQADSHLGHLFEDGPEPTGLRYCINSASLRFVAKENLAMQGYSDYMPLFKD